MSLFCHRYWYSFKDVHSSQESIFHSNSILFTAPALPVRDADQNIACPGLETMQCLRWESKFYDVLLSCDK